ncbi:MAG: endolytic transglycosylase MltG [Clostridiaceae bacterium]|nr:endolytic transglycosylase MltG [Clostridiaceae bacterium]
MKLIDGKSVLLGIGLGIIIASLIGFIFFLGYKPPISDSEIISKAKNLGMVDPYEAGEDIKRSTDGSLIITVHEGESFTKVSNRLYEAGLIGSTAEFEILLKKQGLETSIKPGDYSISFHDDTKAIIKKLTQNKE